MPADFSYDWDDLMIAHHAGWLTLARWLSSSLTEKEAGDIVNDVLVDVIGRDKRGALEIKGTVDSYIRKALRNVAMNEWSKATKKTTPVSIETLIRFCGAEEDRELLSVEMRLMIDIVNNKLGTQAVTVLIMKDVMGFTYREIVNRAPGRIGGYGTVYELVQKARALLRDNYAEDGASKQPPNNGGAEPKASLVSKDAQ